MCINHEEKIHLESDGSRDSLPRAFDEEGVLSRVAALEGWFTVAVSCQKPQEVEGAELPWGWQAAGEARTLFQAGGTAVTEPRRVWPCED